MKATRILQTERQAQLVVVTWLYCHQIAFLHIPNEGKRTRYSGGRLKQEGLMPGAPDILVFTPPPLRPDARGVAIEMKREGSGGRVTLLQHDWLGRLQQCGWLASVCRGSDEALAYLQSLGYSK